MNTELKRCRRCAKWRRCTRTHDMKWICFKCKENDEQIAKWAYGSGPETLAGNEDL